VTIASQVQIFNLALNAVGARDNISSPSESSREAEVCSLWYEPVRDLVLAAAPWPEATEFAYLAQVGEVDDEWTVGDPRPGYSYVYGAPVDMLHPRYLTDFSSFLMTAYSDNRKAIHTNTYQAIMAYTKRLEVISVWGPELQMSIVMGLAAFICTPLTGKPSRAKALETRANGIILSARENSANMSNESYEHIPDWITARGYNSTATTRYIYPQGSLLSVN
jgi:hypothetical protein